MQLDNKQVIAPLMLVEFFPSTARVNVSRSGGITSGAVFGNSPTT